MSRHIIKYTHDEGKKFLQPLVWCGANVSSRLWLFQDAQHALLSMEQGSSITPCEGCLNAIRTVLTGELTTVKSGRMDDPATFGVTVIPPHNKIIVKEGHALSLGEPVAMPKIEFGKETPDA